MPPWGSFPAAAVCGCGGLGEGAVRGLTDLISGRRKKMGTVSMGVALLVPSGNERGQGWAIPKLLLWAKVRLILETVFVSR